MARWATATLSGVHPGISRRGLLRAVAATAGLAGIAATAGCDLFGGSSDGQEDVTPELRSLLTATIALGDAYDGAITRVPSLASRLSGLRDAHRAHADALARALAQPTPERGSNSAGPTDAAGALSALAELESKGVDTARQSCLNGPARLASLIGTIAAARSCHLEVLR
jgi:hypothetical protein